MYSRLLKILALSSLALGHMSRNSEYVDYTTITGIFLQDEDATVPGSFDYVSLTHLRQKPYS